MLVDDDETFGHALAKFLLDAGLQVTVALDYRKALQVLEGDEQVDLLLTDIVMPDRVNGLALARMALLRRPSIKVIYLSGYDIPGLDDEALGPVLHKPIESEHILDEIRRVLKGRGRRRRPQPSVRGAAAERSPATADSGRGTCCHQPVSLIE